MLINKLLQKNNYIFTNNVSKKHLKMLVDVGSIPIFMYNNNEYWTFAVLVKDGFVRLNLRHIKTSDCRICTISDIKNILYHYKFFKTNIFYYIGI